MSDLNILPADQNRYRAAGFESSSTAGLVMAGQIDEITGRILVDSAVGSGTVTSVSVVSANGFAGSVATATTTPAITLSTTITGFLQGNGTAISAASTTGSGSVLALQTSPSFVTPDINVATADSLQAGTTSAGLLLKNNDGVTVASFGVGSAASTNIALIGATAITGALTATTYQGLTITSTTGTLTITNAKTLSVSNSLTLAGTDSTVMTFPSTTATIARTDAGQTFTGLQTYSNAVNYTNNAITASANAATVPITARVHTVTNNSAATLTITITTTSAVDGQLHLIRVLDFSAVAQTITWVNTENSTVSAPTTSNGSTTLPLTVGFQYNSATSKWRCIASA